MQHYPEGQMPQSQHLPGSEKYMVPQPVVISPTYLAAGKLKGKAALITGGDSGIGRAVAVHFAREGASVAIVYLPEEEKDALETREMVLKEGGKCILIPGDVKSEAFCKAAVQKTLDELGAINILVNNAATQITETNFLDMKSENMEITFKTNIFSMFYFSLAAVPHMKQGDCIINTASVTAYRGSAGLIDYASTKGAIVAFTRSLSGNLAKKKIRVNGVAPGPVWTPLIPASNTPEKTAKFGTDTPMERAGQPAEIAPSYVFLASEDASYFTGQFLHPNGGEIVNT